MLWLRKLSTVHLTEIILMVAAGLSQFRQKIQFAIA